MTVTADQEKEIVCRLMIIEAKLEIDGEIVDYHLELLHPPPKDPADAWMSSSASLEETWGRI